MDSPFKGTDKSPGAFGAEPIIARFQDTLKQPTAKKICFAGRSPLRPSSDHGARTSICPDCGTLFTISPQAALCPAKRATMVKTERSSKKSDRCQTEDVRHEAPRVGRRPLRPPVARYQVNLLTVHHARH